MRAARGRRSTALGVLAAVAIVCGLGGCGRDRGAIVARWRLWDSALGKVAAGCGLAPGEPGSTCCGAVYNDASPEDPHRIYIDKIVLRVVPLKNLAFPDAGDLDCPSCQFNCAQNEATTDFEIPEGQYKLWLEPRRCGDSVPRVATPPAVVRTVTAGEITNLDAIQITLYPSTCSNARLCSQEDAGCGTDGPLDAASDLTAGDLTSVDSSGGG